MTLPVPRNNLRRFWRLLPLLLLAAPLAGCRIEQTPAEYIDVIDIPEDDLSASADELSDRLLSTAPSLERRNLNDLLSALTPAAEVFGFGPGEGELITDPTTLGFSLSQATGGRDVSLAELNVEVGPRNNVAWFRSLYSVQGADEDAYEIRFSGVFLRIQGEWRLVQAHVSRPVSSDSLPPLRAEADTLVGVG